MRSTSNTMRPLTSASTKRAVLTRKLLTLPRPFRRAGAPARHWSEPPEDPVHSEVVPGPAAVHALTVVPFASARSLPHSFVAKFAIASPAPDLSQAGGAQVPHRLGAAGADQHIAIDANGTGVPRHITGYA